jgi:hypothetical protein
MRDIDMVIEEARALVLPFESWERLKGETAAAFAAFGVYRDFGAERTIKKAVEGSVEDSGAWGKRYRMWLVWSTQFKWRDRAADYDRYLDRLKQAEKRKTIEAQGEAHRRFTEKLLAQASKGVDMTDPAGLAPGALRDWGETAIRLDREGAGLVVEKDGAARQKAGITFAPEFEGVVGGMAL